MVVLSVMMMVAVLIGVLTATAADPDASIAARYDASILATTGDLVVVDHHTQKMYIYAQYKGDWVMRSFTDLSQVGSVKIEPQAPPAAELKKALGRDDG